MKHLRDVISFSKNTIIYCMYALLAIVIYCHFNKWRYSAYFYGSENRNSIAMQCGWIWIYQVEIAAPWEKSQYDPNLLLYIEQNKSKNTEPIFSTDGNPIVLDKLKIYYNKDTINREPSDRVYHNRHIATSVFYVEFAIVSVLLTDYYYRRRKQKMMLRIQNGLCLKCGYDLRATPDRCPECGTVPEKAIKQEKSAPAREYVT